jgi:hypothetical protein
MDQSTENGQPKQPKAKQGKQRKSPTSRSARQGEDSAVPDLGGGGAGLGDGSGESGGGAGGGSRQDEGSSIPWIRMRASQRYGKNHPELHVHPQAAAMLSAKVRFRLHVAC